MKLKCLCKGTKINIYYVICLKLDLLYLCTYYTYRLTLTVSIH